MYNSAKTVTVTLTADEAVAILRNRDSQWTVAEHLENAEDKIQEAVFESLKLNAVEAKHQYAIKNT
jgi:hypothetical protein